MITREDLAREKIVIVELICGWRREDDTCCYRRASYAVSPWAGDLKDGMFCAEHARAMARKLNRLNQEERA